MNDATAFAVSEAWIGVGKEYPRMIAITLGTGFGSAFLNNGLPVLEGESVPENGCAWHLPFLNGIADEYFSTRWFERAYTERTGKAITGARYVADNYQTDPVAKALMDEYGTNLGTFLAPLIRQFGADHIVMGGNISAAYPLFSSAMHHVFASEGIKAGVSLSVLKESAAILGSVRLIDNGYYEKILPLLSLM
jgi:glucokinase